MTLTPGTSLGSYEVLGPLGAGGMGEVYRARDRKLGRDVALKILPEAFLDDSTRLARFDREARILASLNHPTLAAIYGLETAGPIRYIVMELVPGETLAQVLTRGPLPLEETLAIARQIAQALEAAHDKGVVHRDLKPSNIMITPDGRVKVLDLGLAKAMEVRTESESLSESPTLPPDETRSGVILGTMEFMSPEQARGKPLDKRTDVWAFGCVLFEMLTGRRAFSGDTPSDIIASILTREPDWAALPVATPARVRELLERCLQKEATRRLRDAGDARIVLEDTVAESAERPAPSADRAPHRRRQLVIAMLAVLAAAAGIWRARQPRAAGPSGSKGTRLLAVLPFRDLSGLPGGQLLGDGLVETVSVRLASVSGIQLVTPAATVAASDRERDIFRIARDLGADLILRGAVQRQADRIRITYSVWNAQTRVQVAGGDLNGAASDLFSIQDQLTERVARELRLPTQARRTPRPTGLPSTAEQEHYLQALGHLQRYDKPESVDAAIRLLDGLAQGAPDSALVQAALARACLSKYSLTHDLEWVGRAIGAADRASRLDAELPEVHQTRGLILVRTGKDAEAIDEFRIALSLVPNSLEATLSLAGAYQSIGRTGDAEAAYRRAVALAPSYWSVYNSFGVFYYRLGKYPQAAQMFHRVVELLPDNVRGWNSLGGAYYQADQLDRALDAFTRSARVRPNDGAYSNLGTLQFFLGRYRESVEAFEHAVRLTPGKSLYWFNLGDAYRWAPGLRSKAGPAYERAITLAREQLAVNPRDGDELVTIGLSLAKTGRPDEGFEQIRKALEVEPGNPDYLYDAALVSSLLGKTEDAVGWLKRAVVGGLAIRQIEREPEFEDLRRTAAYRRSFPVQKAAA